MLINNAKPFISWNQPRLHTGESTQTRRRTNTPLSINDYHDCCQGGASTNLGVSVCEMPRAVSPPPPSSPHILSDFGLLSYQLDISNPGSRQVLARVLQHNPGLVSPCKQETDRTKYRPTNRYRLCMHQHSRWRKFRVEFRCHQHTLVIEEHNNKMVTVKQRHDDEKLGNE